MFEKISKAFKRVSCNLKIKAASTALGKRYVEYRKNRQWEEFHLEHVSLVEYAKPYQTPSYLVNKWIREGLIIIDRKQAEQVIFRESYFRLKAYAIPFFDQTTEKFYPGTTFEELNALYCADQRLRDFLLAILAQHEVRIRATVDNVVTSTTNDPFWHIQREYFKNFIDVERVLKKAQQRFDQGKQEFVLHYRKRYYTKKSYEYRRTPPFWIISEIFTLEQLLSVCKSLNEKCPKFLISPGKNKLDTVAAPFGFHSYGALLTNLGCILELRNVCAHHTRLWNRNLKAPAGLKSIPQAHPNRLYSHLLMLRISCKAQGINDEIQPFMKEMFAKVPVFSRDMANMGFPQNWCADATWA